MALKSTTSHIRNEQQSVVVPAVLKARHNAAQNVPVIAGLCLPKGQVKDAFRGTVDGFDRAVPAQLEVLNRWNDGSVRWMLASFVAPDACPAGKELGIVVDCQSSNEGNVDTGGCGTDSLTTVKLTTVKIVNGEIIVVSQDLRGDLPTERIVRLRPQICDLNGEELPLQFDGIRDEVIGSIRQVFVISARIQSMPFVTLQLRLTHWSDVGLLQAETRIRNTRRAKHAGGLWDLGDSGSFVFRSLELSIRSDEVPANATTHWKLGRDQTVRSSMAEVFLRQHGSGGRFWSSPNHISAANSIDIKTRGYETHCEFGTLRGYRAEPTFLIEGDNSSLAIAVPEFWQQFPGSIASAMGTMEVGFFPALAGVTHELQGGEQKTQSCWIATHCGDSDLNNLDWVFDAPRLMQSARSISQANVMPWFSADCNDSRCRPSQPEETVHGSDRLDLPLSSPLQSHERFMHYLSAATSDRFNLNERRASIDEYGWRNFGDVPADHEQTHYAGSNTIVSHYNNQFDMIFGGILQMASTADLKWFDLFDPLARHVMDIDIYHTSVDRAAFNGGLFWHTDHYVDAQSCTHRTYSKHNQKPGQPYGGGPSCEHNYTTGLLHYHFLTGSFEARDTVLSLADWVIQMDDGRNTVFGLLDDGPTGAASATVFEDYHGPGRGAGNSINALLDAWLLTNSSQYLSKLEELIRRCVHPSQNPDDLHLLDAEGHWSYTVFLNSLGRYLIAKRDAEMFDAMYSYSRDVMKTYGRWMSVKERRTLDCPEELQYPTEAWAAQDFRKANVLRIAATCEDDIVHAAAMRKKADEINDSAWKDFEAFGDSSLTARCLSIVMTEGHRDVFHRIAEPALIPACNAQYDFGSWSMFVPQKIRIKKLLKSPARLLKASFKAFNVGRIRNTLQAFRRQI